MKRFSSSSFALVLPLLVMSAAAPAWAAPPTKEACIGAFDRGQEARRKGHLKQSREELVVCAQQECPAVIRADCAGVLRQVEAAQPTVVLKAEDAKGVDLTDVTVDLDGKPLTVALDGRATAVDPGKLTFVFKRPPWDPVTVESVIAENEKGRIVKAVLGPPAPKVATPTDNKGAFTQETPPATREALEAHPRSTVGWIVPGAFAVIGVGALAFAGINRIGVGNEADDLRSSCAPECSQADRDRLSGDLVTTNVMLGVGIGSLALAVVSWFVFAPSSSSSSAASSKTAKASSIRFPLMAW